MVTLGPAERIIGADGQGRLRAADASDRGALSPRVQAQLSFHEVASAPKVSIEADELYLFDLQIVELLRDAPGVNDPLFLYGVLRGPYPAALAAETSSVDGQLAVSRADLLAGLLDGVEDAFLLARASGLAVRSATRRGAAESDDHPRAASAAALASPPRGDAPRREVAQHFGKSRTQVYRWMEKYDLEPEKDRR